MTTIIIMNRRGLPSWWPLPGEVEPFDVIGMDWPWAFEVYNEATGNGRSAEKHYNTRLLDWDDHGSFVKWLWPFMAQNCALPFWMTRPTENRAMMQIEYMWNRWIAEATNWLPKEGDNRKRSVTELGTPLPRAKDRIVYKTELFTLVKYYLARGRETCMEYASDGSPVGYDDTQVGTGYYTRGNTEGCRLYVRGQKPRQDAGVRQVIKIYPDLLPDDVDEHSYKPDVWRRRIDRLWPGGSKLELFARRNPQESGWTFLGNEISGQDIRDDLERLALARVILDRAAA